MPTYVILNKEEIENKIFNSQLCCQQEVVIVKGITSTRPIIMAFGIATCTVCIIFDPTTKLTLFSHIDELIKIQQSQFKLLSYLKEKNIDLAQVKVFIAGGRVSQTSSMTWAQQLKEFWKNHINIENLNDELLLKRDCFSLDFQEVAAYAQSKWSQHEMQEYNVYIKSLEKSNDTLDSSYIYLQRRARRSNCSENCGTFSKDV